MTAKELIKTLESILDERAGEDLEVRMCIDFESSYGIVVVNVIDDVEEFDGADIVLLQSPESADASVQYDPRLKIPEKKGLN